MKSRDQISVFLSVTFCQHCIGEWRKRSNTCPSCRKGIKSENRVYLLDEILEKVESEMDREEDREKIQVKTVKSTIPRMPKTNEKYLI